MPVAALASWRCLSIDTDLGLRYQGIIDSTDRFRLQRIRNYGFAIKKAWGC
jgi:hypothetical protein